MGETLFPIYSARMNEQHRRPKSWRGCLYINQLLYHISISWLNLLNLMATNFSFDDVTLQTSHREDKEKKRTKTVRLWRDSNPSPLRNQCSSILTELSRWLAEPNHVLNPSVYPSWWITKCKVKNKQILPCKVHDSNLVQPK